MQTSNPINQDLYLAAKERMGRTKKRKPSLSTFARPPAPKAPGSRFRRQTPY